MPNPPFNREKGFEGNCYDRLDLFMKTDTFKNNPQWGKWFEENKEKYHLEIFIKNDLGIEFLDLLGNIEERKKDNIKVSDLEFENLRNQCCIYIDKVIDIIKKEKNILILIGLIIG